MSDEEMRKLAEIAAKLRIGGYRRHVFLCIGDSCCSKQQGEAAWDALKRELKERNLSPGTAENSCYRTKVGCLRVCSNGPIAVVYPEGTYYCELTAERIPEFVQRHLIGGQPVEEWVFVRNPLPSDDSV
jgi:(2Fe-2S) ferredoxin